ncbi:MAG: hypothetical protein WCP97_05900 [bacterium]
MSDQNVVDALWQIVDQQSAFSPEEKQDWLERLHAFRDAGGDGVGDTVEGMCFQLIMDIFGVMGQEAIANQDFKLLSEWNHAARTLNKNLYIQEAVLEDKVAKLADQQPVSGNVGNLPQSS